jgi:hypothetical protein
MIDSNTGYIHMADILNQLWLNFSTAATAAAAAAHDGTGGGGGKFEGGKVADEIEPIDE